jgi:hypothetical protein
MKGRRVELEGPAGRGAYRPGSRRADSNSCSVPTNRCWYGGKSKNRHVQLKRNRSIYNE